MGTVDRLLSLFVDSNCSIIKADRSWVSWCENSLLQKLELSIKENSKFQHTFNFVVNYNTTDIVLQ